MRRQQIALRSIRILLALELDGGLMRTSRDCVTLDASAADFLVTLRIETSETDFLLNSCELSADQTQNSNMRIIYIKNAVMQETPGYGQKVYRKHSPLQNNDS